MSNNVNDDGIGSLVIHKKLVHAHQCKDKTAKTVVAWDAVSICPQGDLCALHLDCPYLPGIRQKGDVSKCMIQKHYVQYVYNNLVEANLKTLDQTQIDQIGLLLIPLYAQLIKFKMIEYSLQNTNDICKVSKMGVYSTHPIYKEIRETIKLISSMSWQVGVSVARKPTVVVGTPTVEQLIEMGNTKMVTDDMDGDTMKPLNYKYEKINPTVQLNRKGSKKMTERFKVANRRCKTVDV